MFRGAQRTTIVLLAGLVIASGCNDENARVARVALDAAQRQAEQNREMTRLNRDIAEGTKRLVEGQAKADQQWQAMQKNIHAQSDQLESERRAQAAARERDSLLAPTLVTLGVLLVCSLPLLLCWKLLTSLEPDGHEATLAQLLIDEMVVPAKSPARHTDPQSLLHGPLATAATDTPARIPIDLG